MEDRVPKYPGKVLVTPEDGSVPFYAVLNRADEPVEEGTPLNKATLFDDATNNQFGFSEDEATPNNALYTLITMAEGAARNIAFQSKPNEIAVRSALGEFTKYAQTYGLGYAIALYANMDDSSIAQMRNYRTRKDIAADSGCMDIMSEYSKAIELWRSYLFTVIGRYRYYTSKGGTVSVNTTQTYPVLTSSNGYYFFVGSSSTSSTSISYYTAYYSLDGRSWNMLGSSNQGRALCFSADNKYLYRWYVSSDNIYCYAYNVNQPGTSVGNFTVSVSVNNNTSAITDEFNVICCNGHYYYPAYGYGNGAYSFYDIYMSTDGYSKGSAVVQSASTSSMQAGWYIPQGTFALGTTAGVFLVYRRTASNIKSGSNIAYIIFIHGNDEIDIFSVEQGHTDYSTGKISFGYQYAGDTTNSLFLSVRVYGDTDADYTDAFYRFNANGTSSVLTSPSSFPIPSLAYEKVGRVHYISASGEAYVPGISSYSGNLVDDAFGSVTDGINVAKGQGRTTHFTFLANGTLVWREIVNGQFTQNLLYFNDNNDDDPIQPIPTESVSALSETASYAELAAAYQEGVESIG